MMDTSPSIRGQRWIPLTVVAECFSVRVAMLEEVYELGLLGPGERAGDTIAIEVRMLDRVARIVRWRVYHGMSLELIVGLLDQELEP